MFDILSRMLGTLPRHSTAPHLFACKQTKVGESNVLYFCQVLPTEGCLVSSGSWVWWYTPVILALGRQRQEDTEFQDSLGYKVSSRPA
jgi:hypothetical protein